MRILRLDQLLDILNQDIDRHNVQDALDRYHTWGSRLLIARHREEFNEIVEREVRPAAQDSLDWAIKRTLRDGEKMGGTPELLIKFEVEMRQVFKVGVLDKLVVTTGHATYWLEEWEYLKESKGDVERD